jgi:hypothetical protein
MYWKVSRQFAVSKAPFLQLKMNSVLTSWTSGSLAMCFLLICCSWKLLKYHENSIFPYLNSRIVTGGLNSFWTVSSFQSIGPQFLTISKTTWRVQSNTATSFLRLETLIRVKYGSACQKWLLLNMLVKDQFKLEWQVMHHDVGNHRWQSQVATICNM